MSMTIDRKNLQEIAKELAKGIKSAKDLSDLSREQDYIPGPFPAPGYVRHGRFKA
ncbi:hypothetical protein MNBD_NITROSPINAE02-969 [hydrothermal vent metagenome]|uniref:Uncharacterized protein n=1 Tax=hydrothermal vent metagenome TaxID=652676 RepID=A0A3B1C6D8_9ZZZZ